MVGPWFRYYFRDASEIEQPDTKILCKAYFLRARARLARGQLSLAEADAKLAGTFAEPEQERQLAKFQREIVEARRSNKRLAKEVAKWCDKAMEKAKPDAFSVVEADLGDAG